MELLNLPAPAKLNLFLHITGQRPNGYHELQSVFVLIDLCDYIDLRLDPSGKITRTGDVIGDVEKDLCVRAARLLKEKTGCPLGVTINVTKKNPFRRWDGRRFLRCSYHIYGTQPSLEFGLNQGRINRNGSKIRSRCPIFPFRNKCLGRRYRWKTNPYRHPRNPIWSHLARGSPRDRRNFFA